MFSFSFVRLAIENHHAPVSYPSSIPRSGAGPASTRPTTHETGKDRFIILQKEMKSNRDG
jgi:hypothetical protein